MQRDSANSVIEPSLRKTQSQGAHADNTINDPKHVRNYNLVTKLNLGMGKVVTQIITGAKAFIISLR